MSRRTRRSSPHRSHRSWQAVRPTARRRGPAWGRRSAPRCRPHAAPWPSHARSRRSPPSPPWSPRACAARQSACGALAAVLGNVCRSDSFRMHASTLSLATSIPTTTTSFCAIIQLPSLLGTGSKPLQLFGLRKTPELSLALPQARSPLGITGSVPATGGWSEPPVRTFCQIFRTQGRRECRVPASTRGLVCKRWCEMRTRAYRYSRSTPAFPAQWFYGLCRRSPRRRIRLASIASELTFENNQRWGKPRLGQPDCIFRLDRPCSFFDIAYWLRGQGVSQFSFMFLLVTALTLTVCVGVAAWRISDDRPDGYWKHIAGNHPLTLKSIPSGPWADYAVAIRPLSLIFDSRRLREDFSATVRRMGRAKRDPSSSVDWNAKTDFTFRSTDPTR